MIKSRLNILFLTAIFALVATQTLANNSDYIPEANIKTKFDDLAKLQELQQIREKAVKDPKAKKTAFVTVIGAGPGGLVAALESYLNGATVVLVEQRQQYARQQVLMIFNKDLKKYSKAFIDADKDTDTIEKIEINRLEEILYSVVKVLALKDPEHFKVLYGYVLDQPALKPIKDDPNGQFMVKVVPAPSRKGQPGIPFIEIPTNFLIGADSVHSSVRKLGNIPEIRISNDRPVLVAVFKNDNKDTMEERESSRDESINQARIKSGNMEKAALIEQQRLAELFYWNDRIVYLGLLLSDEQFASLQEVKDNDHMRQVRAKEIIEAAVLEPKMFLDLEFAEPIGNSKNPEFFKVELLKADKLAKVQNNILLMLLGDAAASTHFFTGTGANRAISDGITIGEIVKSYRTEDKKLDKLASIYEEKTRKSVCEMHETVFKQKLGLENELKALGTPQLTESSKQFALRQSLRNKLGHITRLSESIKALDKLSGSGSCPK